MTVKVTNECGTVVGETDGMQVHWIKIHFKRNCKLSVCALMTQCLALGTPYCHIRGWALYL